MSVQTHEEANQRLCRDPPNGELYSCVIPLVTTKARDALGLDQLLLSPLDLLFGALSFGNLQRDTAHADGFACRIVFGTSFCRKPVERAIRMNHTEFKVVAGALCKRVSEGSLHGLAVLRMNGVDKRLERQILNFRHQAQNDFE